MNYTKYLNRTERFKLVISDKKVKMAQDIMKEIQNSQSLLANFIRLDLKLDIDEYIAYFLKDKNEFMTEFERSLKSTKLSKTQSSNYNNILNIIKGKINKILSDYKFIKQKLLTKLSKKEKFFKIKDTFFQKQISNKESMNQQNSPIIETSIHETVHEPIDSRYNEGEAIINTFKKTETDTLSDTKKMIFDLSDLVTNFSTKVYEQQEITNIICSDTQNALQNIKDGNKELVISCENQKNRGIYIGMTFIILGFFLLFYDYTLIV